MNLNITPDPASCAGVPGGVNSVVCDHAAGFLASGHQIGQDGLNIVHAIAQHENIDIFHCHGLYPIGPGYFDKSYSRANDTVLRNALRAKITICISEFSANILRHKLHIDPIVTRNGIWTKDYRAAGQASGPVIFAKAALDANAKPDDMLWLKRNTDLKLLSIANIPGIASTGKLSRKKFLETLGQCSIYLGTTKENNSMATMEALIMGVPVVGYDIGFNSEWLTSGAGCELVPFGDQVALKDALQKVRSDWRRYSKKAREIGATFDWHPVIEDLLEIYQAAAREVDRKTVSIIIPCHNYEAWIGRAIQSALDQTVKCEVIVVDDFSTDDSVEIARKYPVRIIRNKKNLGVAETRNAGIWEAKGDYIVCLDADDMLHPNFAEAHLAAFRSRQDAIAYAPINLVNEHGAPRNQFLFMALATPALQSVGRNQIPSCCMFRKEYWVRAGGYDGRYTPAEDAHLWLKIFQLGGQAQMASGEAMMDYRVHGNSLSARGFPDWWKDSAPVFSEPIQERDSNLSIFIEEEAEAKQEILWQLEKQKYQKWDCQLKNPGNLQRTFPWLNRSPSSSNKSHLHLKGLPSPNFLDVYMARTPEWIAGTMER